MNQEERQEKRYVEVQQFMEMLDVVDEYGNPTGQVVERNQAHLEGIMHRTSHVWFLRKRNDIVQILLQKRSMNKDSHPGCYDISSAGHIPAGFDYKESAVREIKEELGIIVDTEELICCGDRTVVWDDYFYGKPFHDRQFSKVFFIWKDLDEEDFILQKEEVDSVHWIDFEECITAVKENKINHCIFAGELDMVRAAIEKDDQMNERLEKQLEFALEIDKEKNIFRQTHLSNHGRNENDAEHAWHMAIMAYLLREYSNEKVDISRVMLMCLIHDIVEIEAGDTYAYDTEGLKTQKAREDAAKEKIFSILPEDQKQELIALFDEFEEYQTAESKFAHAMDNLQPLLLNNSNGGGDWKEHQVTAEQVYGRQSKTRLGSEALYEVTDRIIQENIRKGSLRE